MIRKDTLEDLIMDFFVDVMFLNREYGFTEYIILN
jgi:hypothetical protein